MLFFAGLLRARGAKGLCLPGCWKHRDVESSKEILSLVWMSLLCSTASAGERIPRGFRD